MFKNIRLKKSKQEYDVITVGSGTQDVFVNTDSKILKEKHKNRKDTELIAYPLGSKLLIESLKFEIGGGGTNTAVAFARMGLKTGWIGSIGDCENSKSIIKNMKEENVDFLGTCTKGRAGYSVILDSKVNDRTILTFKGENNNLKFNNLNKKEIAKTKWMYFCSMVGDAFIAQKRIARFAKKNKIKIAFNPSSYQAKAGLKELKSVLKNTNILILNREEAGLLTKQNDLDKIFSKIHLSGPSIVIITDGKDGAICSDGIHKYKAHAHKIKVKETTGAGDAFAASFLGTFIKTNDIEKSLKFAVINSQSVIQEYGAKNVLLGWKDLERMEKKKPVKITKK